MTINATDNYDLSTTGVLAELTNTSSDPLYGFQVAVDNGSAITFEVEIEGGGSDPFIVVSTQTDRIDDGFFAPEADTIRIRNTTTATDTAEAVLGSGGIQ
jgi:hypothetical protein